MNSRIKPKYVKAILCNRNDHAGVEQYLVQWAGNYPPDQTPYSWHTLDELALCLHLVQEYLNRQKIASSQSSSAPSRKRKSPPDSEDSDLELLSWHVLGKEQGRALSNQTSTTLSKPSEFGRTSRDGDVYNGVVKVRNGWIKVEPSLEDGVRRAFGLPSESMIRTALTSSTRAAEKLIRDEVVTKLRGLSGPPVKLLNLVDRTSPPLRFHFIDECVLGKGVVKASPDTITGCQKCRPDMGQKIGCEYTRKCDCLEYAAVDVARLSDEERELYETIQEAGGDTSGLPKRFPYFSSGSKTGCLVPQYLESRNVVYECNVNCRCGPVCKNRNVQKGRQVELEIFKTTNRGWGLRCPHDLKEGQFIDTYRGEIITGEEADRREETDGKRKDNSYLYSLDKFAETQGIPADDLYVVDGEHMGGPTRFMNHSCEPNCRQYTVSYNKHDYMVYEIAFFAIRPIPAKEELTFDYLDKDDDDENEGVDQVKADEHEERDGSKPVRCLCGSKKCRKWLWI